MGRYILADCDQGYFNYFQGWILILGFWIFNPFSKGGGLPI